MYTKDMFKLEFEGILKAGYDPVLVAKKASHLFHHCQSLIDVELSEIMLDIMTMEDGPEFEMTEGEFLKFLDEI